METTQTTQTVQICPTHHLLFLSCTKEGCNFPDSSSICRLCVSTNKDSLQHFIDHFDSISKEDTEYQEYSKKLKDYEGYVDLNKIYQEHLLSAASSIDELFAGVSEAKNLIISQLRESCLNKYGTITDEFEVLVKSLTEKLTNINLSDNKSRQEIKQMKLQLENKTNFLSDNEGLVKEFVSIIEKCQKRINSMKVADLVAKKFNFSTKHAQLSTDWTHGNNSITTTPRGSSYWHVKSVEVLDGSFTAKVRVVNINSSYAGSAWNFSIGIIKADSVQDNAYYNDSIYLMSYGPVGAKFAGSEGARLFNTIWKNGDLIIISRDENNNVFFGVNDEDNLQKAYDNVEGNFRIMIGFSTSVNGDIFELEELYK